MNTAPKEIRENIARAKGYLRRDEIPRALDTMASAIRAFADVTLFKTARFETVIQLEGFLDELNKHPQMQVLLDPHQTGKPRVISFQQGKEKVLATVLEGLAKILLSAAQNNKAEEQHALEQRKRELIATGKMRIEEGDIARGRSFLKRAAAEFGQEAGVLVEIGRVFLSLGQFQDAAESFESATDAFPKEAEAYAEAIEAHTKALEYAKAEKMYLKIFRQFGGHANTYGRLAKLYVAWQKRPKAEEFAFRALQLDPTQADALAVMQTLNTRNI